MAIKKQTKKAKTNPRAKKSSFFVGIATFFSSRFKASHFTTGALILGLLAAFLTGILFGVGMVVMMRPNVQVAPQGQEKEYWLELLRKSQKERLYYGVPGDKRESKVVKEFTVKTGVPGMRPTPLPQALGKKYWKIIKKYSSSENPETAPYFLELDIPVEEGFFGPVPYLECDGQCSWELPGYFGLHGVNGDNSRLSSGNSGSSGCIRHTDKDITYLYNLLEVDEGVRYYIVDL